MRIVVGIDYSDIGELALHRAADHAGRYENAVLHVIAVAEGDGPRLPEDLTHDAKEAFIEDARQTLHAYIEERLEPKTLGIRTHVKLGSPAKQIVALAAELEADLVVVGTHGRRGFRRLVMGSVAEDVVRNAPCPVMVVRPVQLASAGSEGD